MESLLRRGSAGLVERDEIWRAGSEVRAKSAIPRVEVKADHGSET
jgi:hypothetical protein